MILQIPSFRPHSPLPSESHQIRCWKHPVDGPPFTRPEHGKWGCSLHFPPSLSGQRRREIARIEESQSPSPPFPAKVLHFLPHRAQLSPPLPNALFIQPDLSPSDSRRDGDYRRDAIVFPLLHPCLRKGAESEAPSSSISFTPHSIYRTPDACYRTLAGLSGPRGPSPSRRCRELIVSLTHRTTHSHLLLTNRTTVTSILPLYCTLILRRIGIPGIQSMRALPPTKYLWIGPFAKGLLCRHTV